MNEVVLRQTIQKHEYNVMVVFLSNAHSSQHFNQNNKTISRTTRMKHISCMTWRICMYVHESFQTETQHQQQYECWEMPFLETETDIRSCSQL